MPYTFITSQGRMLYWNEVWNQSISNVLLFGTTKIITPECIEKTGLAKFVALQESLTCSK